ncbi:DUF4124 domain-containing protein [Sulfurirhabdus autotrophica]|uniref:DUF4124 domain-containing protein n=1 Tax=Sulfurirhabdus autotrophica TaxID=1706046 RepID=A0A4R3Y489_9PROT|nr:DUF4124 domain-containing protein [Sulfurirhabdus autotrophica]TCV86362.1 hypothetical protein EDC63_10750 [Sulfurirhabdus autotrophica]
MSRNTTVDTMQVLKALAVIFLSATWFQHVYAAEVFKCVVNGKTTYQATPCTSGGKTLQINAGISSESSAEAHRRVLNEKKVVQDLERRRDSQAPSTQASSNSSHEDADQFRKQQEKKLIADCEANHGVRCRDPKVIEENKILDTPITPQEQQKAIAERRARKNDAFY